MNSCISINIHLQRATDIKMLTLEIKIWGRDRVTAVLRPNQGNRLGG